MYRPASGAYDAQVGQYRRCRTGNATSSAVGGHTVYIVIARSRHDSLATSFSELELRDLSPDTACMPDVKYHSTCTYTLTVGQHRIRKVPVSPTSRATTEPIVD